MKVSQRGLDLIKKYEGFRARRYLCPAGKWTIGYGHVLNDEENFTEIDQQEAEKLLKQDITKAEAAINKHVKISITQGQFDALVSLVFNWGASHFLRSKGLHKLNNRDFEGAIEEFKEVNKVGGVIMTGLVERREEEKSLFCA